MSTVKFDTWKSKDGTNEYYKCRVWVNFDGIGTVAIRGSGNVSSVTDLGVGKYRLNFSTAMPDTNYATVFYNNALDSTTIDAFNNAYAGGLGGVTTTSVEVASFNTGAFVDSRFFNVAIFR